MGNLVPMIHQNSGRLLELDAASLSLIFKLGCDRASWWAGRRAVRVRVQPPAVYKQLAQDEHGWREIKQIIELLPVQHRTEDRFRAHVILCWRRCC